MAEKGPKKFSRFMRHFPTTYIKIIIYHFFASIISCACEKSISYVVGLIMRSNESVFNDSSYCVILN